MLSSHSGTVCSQSPTPLDLVATTCRHSIELLDTWGILEHDAFGHICFTKQAAAVAALLIYGSSQLWGWMRVLTFPFLAIAYSARVILGAYQAANIIIDLALGVSVLLFLILQDYMTHFVWHRASKARHLLNQAKDYREYYQISIQVDEEEERLAWRGEERDMPQAILVNRTLKELQDALDSKDLSQLRFVLGGVFRRNHLGLDSVSLHNHCLSGTKYIIDAYRDKIKECLHVIRDSKDLRQTEKHNFFGSARRSLGRSALCLSGGGSITMYHMGVVKALIDAGLFQYIKVITGASGGSILAGMIAMKTEDELAEKVLTEEFSTDFKGEGEMAKEQIKWFFTARRFPIFQLITRGSLINRREFVKTCRFYFGDVTFAEAYAKTRRHVNISVSSSSLVGYEGGEELLLNHLTTPNILVRSAVVASCSLPGIMRPSQLLYKAPKRAKPGPNHSPDASVSRTIRGQDSQDQAERQFKGQLGQEYEIERFLLNGIEWIDGSVQADIPFRGISTMFSVSNPIVSQVNFHVVPFLADEQSKLHKNWFQGIFKMLASDISYRVSALQQLRLFPRFFGQDISTVFKQTYSGQVTIVPPFRVLDSSGTHAILTPGKEEMNYYISTGERSCWRHMSHIIHLMDIEIELINCIAQLKAGRSSTRRRGSSIQTQRSLEAIGTEIDELSVTNWSMEEEEADDDLTNQEFRFVARKPGGKRKIRVATAAGSDEEEEEGEVDSDGQEPGPIPRAFGQTLFSPGHLLTRRAEDLGNLLRSPGRLITWAAEVKNRVNWLEMENQMLSRRLAGLLKAIPGRSDRPRRVSTESEEEKSVAKSIAREDRPATKQRQGGSPLHRRHSLPT